MASWILCERTFAGFRPSAAGDGAAAPALDAALDLVEEPVSSIEGVAADPDTVVYNLLLDGNNTYFANDYLVHNKGSGSCCFVAGTQVRMADSTSLGRV